MCRVGGGDLVCKFFIRADDISKIEFSGESIFGYIIFGVALHPKIDLQHGVIIPSLSYQANGVSGIIRGCTRILWTIAAHLAFAVSFSVTCRFCIS